MQWHENGWRIPDRVFIGLAAFVSALTWALLIYFYPLLPSKVVTHFGPSGMPDAYAAKNFWVVYLPGLLQLAIGALLLLVYRHPQYANMPFSMTLQFVPEPWRSKLAKLMRHMLVMTLVIICLVMAYLAEATISASFGTIMQLNNWIVLGLIAFLLAVIGVYTSWAYRIAKEASQSQPAK